MEAVSITMSSNFAHFSNRYFTQIDGAAKGSPDSCSVTDIYGAIHIDRKLMEESPKKPQDYKCYRDDILDICVNSSEEEKKELTLFHIGVGGGANSAFFIISIRDAAEPQNLVTFPKI